MSMDHIPSAELCQCWLKSGPVKYTTNKVGVTSGEPPPRRSLPSPEPPAGGPSLFCWALTVPEGEEPTLLKWQASKKAGIFGCDKAAVYSNQPVNIGGEPAHVIESDMKCEYGGDSQSALNTWIFIAAWKKVLEDGYHAAHDWTAKVDPDTVFFPNRLKALLTQHPREAYLSNCQYGLHGPLEVFSKTALLALAADYQ